MEKDQLSYREHPRLGWETCIQIIRSQDADTSEALQSPLLFNLTFLSAFGVQSNWLLVLDLNLL